jgi:hypothetical protein
MSDYTTPSYEEGLKSRGVETIGSQTFGHYQGDYIFIVKNSEGELGFVVIGYGSCSGCDALEACETEEQFNSLLDSVVSNIRWGSKEELISHINNEFDDNNWYRQEKGFKESIDILAKIVERGEKMSWQEELNVKRVKLDGWYGCIAPDGWRKIVEETDAMLLRLDPEYEITQVKEKFGTLRYYYDSVLPYYSIERKIMDSIVLAAETRSSRTCEICGKYGELRDDQPYIRTLCDEHSAERINKENSFKTITETEEE